MTMNQMQYFSAVCRYHNITKAAKILMISQPGLSARLSELEAEVGVKLLERTSKGVSPTEEGARLLAHVEAVLGRYRLLQNDLPAIAQGRSTVRVGFRPYSGEAEMIQLCRDFQQCFPETRVVFNEMRNVTPSLFLDEDQFDFLATTMRLLPPDWQEKYGYCVLGEMEEVKLYCHAMNRLAKLGEIGLAELDRCPIAFWDGHREVLERLRAAMDSRGCVLNHVATLPQLSGIANLICNDAAVGMLNGDFVDHIGIIHGCRLKQELSSVFLSGGPIQLYLVWKRSSERYENMRKFIEFARKRSRQQKWPIG